MVGYFIANPHSSLTWAANVDNLPSRSSIHRILKDEKFHPYKLQLRQELKPVDRDKRVEHAISMLDLIDSSSFLDNVLFSDEAHFHKHGSVNKQDFRYWCQENPRWYREAPLHSPRVTVWAAIGCRGIVGPIFFDENLNGVNYLQMLQQQFLPAVEGKLNFFSLISGDPDLVFMQDGAPPHWAVAVRNWLDENFALRWMGRGSPSSPAPFAWPPYSPDLTPCDFFLWGWIKSQVYTTPVASMVELRQRIERAFENLPQQMINNAIGAYRTRLEYCLEVHGKSVEQEYD